MTRDDGRLWAGLRLTLKLSLGSIVVMILAIIHFYAIFFLPAISDRTLGTNLEWPTIGVVFVSFLISTTFAINVIVKLKV